MITVLVSGEGDYEYALNDVDGPYQDSNIFEDVLPGLYTVFVRDKNDCGIADELVSVIGFPKFFTPNGDTINETWHIVGIETLPGSIVYIFDRYGKLIKQLGANTSGWDGRYNGNNMPASDYWFLAEIKGGDKAFNVRGHFALKR